MYHVIKTQIKDDNPARRFSIPRRLLTVWKGECISAPKKYKRWDGKGYRACASVGECSFLFALICNGDNGRNVALPARRESDWSQKEYVRWDTIIM
jgi:hypothetical protein